MAFRTSKLKYVVCISDLHAGSAFAPCPPKIATQYDLNVYASRVQCWLFQCWQHFLDDYVPSIVGKEPFAVVVNGDAKEGLHHGSKELVCVSEKVHTRIAIDLLRPLANRAAEFYVVAGTECHTHDDEDEIGEKLGAVRCGDTDRYAPDYWDLKVRGCLTSFRHHIGTSARRGLLATQLSLQLMEEQGIAAGGLTEAPRFIVRSHRHTFGSYDDGDGGAMVLPPWQLPTRHVHNKVPVAIRGAKIGGVVLDYSRVADPFDLPTVHRKLYRVGKAGK